MKSKSRRTLTGEHSVQVMLGLARALDALHREGIVHGRIGIDQVWWDGNEDVTLLRDRSFTRFTSWSQRPHRRGRGR